MYEERPKLFGGIAGRVLRESVTPGTFLTGFSLVCPLAIISALLGINGNDGLVTPLAHIFAVMALSRFALNGYAGQWRGTIYSQIGGNMMTVLMVAFRFTLLSCVWLVPLHIAGFRAEETTAAIGMAALGMGGSGALMLGTIYITCVMLSPPVFLIASVGATSVVDLFSPSYWQGLFSGRKADLFLVYALYLGGLTMTALLLLPFLVMVGSLGTELIFISGAGSLVYISGLAVTLLGRLCGFFAAGGGTEELESTGIPPELTPDMMGPGPDGEKPDRPKAPLFRSIYAATGGGGDSTLRTPTSKDTSPGGKSSAQTGVAGRVENTVRLFEADPAKAIQELKDLNKEHGKNAIILAALARLLLRDGQETEAISTARWAIQLGLQMGTQKSSAEVYRAFEDHVGSLELKLGEELRIANMFRSMMDLESAAKAYRRLIEADCGNAGAVKGMLQVAEAYFKQKGAPTEALKIYEFLLQHCPDSPLVEFMREGRAEAEQRIAKKC